MENQAQKKIGRPLDELGEKDKKVLVFGDSFVKIFEVVKNPGLKFFKYKGGTMKGVTRPNNKNRKDIEGQIKNSKQVDIAIFNFGQVDYNFSCYYKLVRQEPYEQEEIISEYFEWISKLENVKMKLIINIYPSPLTKQTICGALIKYMILTRDQVLENKQRILTEFQNHYRRFQKWQSLFKAYSKRYENIKLINLTNRILDTKDKVRKAYRDINPYNIHILWKKLIYDLKQKMEGHLVLEIDNKQIQKGEEEYEANKRTRMKEQFKEYDFLV